MRLSRGGREGGVTVTKNSGPDRPTLKPDQILRAPMCRTGCVLFQAAWVSASWSTCYVTGGFLAYAAATRLDETRDVHLRDPEVFRDPALRHVLEEPEVEDGAFPFGEVFQAGLGGFAVGDHVVRPVGRAERVREAEAVVA